MKCKKINIMLIDDDEAAHVIHKVNIEDALIDLDNVKSYYGADDALNDIRSINDSGNINDWPAYIFLDINMPNKTGFDFIDEFQEIKLNFEMPKIYLVSSSVNPRDAYRANELKLVNTFKSKFLDKDFFDSLDS